ncbi:MAG: hypothetical protein ACFFAU_01260 [Candidatus Hodarchaeota archaeon]
MAYENLTTYTEVDPNTKWSQTTTRSSFTQVQGDDTGYVYKDYGADYFTDFEHFFDVRIDNTDTLPWGEDVRVGVWEVTNNPGRINDAANDGSLYIRVYFYGYYSTTKYRFVLEENKIGGGWNTDQTSSIFDKGTTYYLKAIRSSTSLTLKIYPTDSDRTNDTNVIDTLSITIATTSFRYFQCGMGGGYSSHWITGYSEYYDIGAPAVTIGDYDLKSVLKKIQSTTYSLFSNLRAKDRYIIKACLKKIAEDSYVLKAFLNKQYQIIACLKKTFSNSYNIISILLKSNSNTYTIVSSLAKAVISSYSLTANLLGYMFKKFKTVIAFYFDDAKSSVEIKEAYIEEGDYISSLDVTIKLKVDNAIYMRFQNDSYAGSWSSWETYSEEKEWTLSAGDGVKKIYCQFQDAAGENSREDFYIETNYSGSSFVFPTINAYTEKGGSIITDSVYQTDDTPYFKWSIPDYGDMPIMGYSYAIDEDPDDIIDIPSDYRVVSGFEVTPAGGMTVNVATGKYNYTYELKEIPSITNLTFDAADPSLDRIDRIYINAQYGTVNIVKGTPAASPVAPDLSYGLILVAQVYITAADGTISSGDITDERENYGEIDVVTPIGEGIHTFKIKAKARNGIWSSVGSFNLYVSSKSPDIGRIHCWKTASKLFEINDGEYQSDTQIPYFEWTVPSAPGTMEYYYTADNTEPDGSSLHTSDNHIILDLTGNRSTVLRVRAKDQYGTWGKSRSFNFIYSPDTEDGSISISEDVVVIGGSVTLRQSKKQCQVHTVSFDLRSARICVFEEPIDFDGSESFQLYDTINVVYEGTTVFSGKIKSIQRSIDINNDTVIYTAAGPRAELMESYLEKYNEDFRQNSSVIKWEDMTPSEIIHDIASLVPSIIKSVSSTPTGPEITLEMTAVTADQAIQAVMTKTGHYGYYMTPQRQLVTVDFTASNPSNVYFGVKGSTVVGSNYDVLASDLDFDASDIYNKCVIEGSRKLKLQWVSAHLIEFPGPKAKQYSMNIDYPVKKVIDWDVKGKVLLDYIGWPGANIFYPMKWVEFYGKKARYVERLDDTNPATGEVIPAYSLLAPRVKMWEEDITITLGPDNTCYSNMILLTKWPAKEAAILKHLGYNSTVRVKVLYEAEPIRVEKTVSSDISETKILRVYDTQFQYDEYEEIDDTSDMEDYAENLLEGHNNIKVKGTVKLKDVYTSWALNKTVNLKNTAKAGWSSLDIPISGITFDIDTHTTILELTSESLL